MTSITTSLVSRTETVREESGVGTCYITKDVERQEWSDDPGNGIYAGKAYRITTFYRSTVSGSPHTMLNRRIEPWT